MALSDEASKWEKIKVKWERLEYLLMTKLYERALLKSGNTPLIEKYKQLRACEGKPYFLN
jgi:hypothetical protein